MTLKAYGAEEKIKEKTEEIASIYYQKRMKRNALNAVMNGVFSVLSNFGLIFAVVWCSISVLNGNADLLKGATIPAVVTTDKLADIRFSDRMVKHIEIWDFCFDGVIRTGEIISFTEKYTSGSYTPKLTLNIFDTDSVSEKRYKSLIYKYSGSDEVNIFIYDTYKSSVQSILRNYPIYNFVSDTAEVVNIAVIGISKDSVASHRKFADKYNLPFTLLADPELQAIQAYGVWQEKKLYGKVSMGVVRTTFIIDEGGHIAKIMPKVKPDTNAAEILEYLKG